MPPLPPDEQRQTDREDARECDDEWIGKPVIAFAAAEDDLERCKPSDQQEEAEHVEWTGALRRLHVGQESHEHDQRRQPERHVKEEDVSPGVPLGQVSADQRSRGPGADDHAEGENNQRFEATKSGIRAIDGGLCSGEEIASRETHYPPEY